jgi:iron complex transport system permease protein
MSAATLGVVLVVALVGIGLASLAMGSTARIGLGETLQGLMGLIGLADPLDGSLQTIAELRLYKLGTSIGVGAALALSGALFQGVFRNQLASPSIIGVTAGASLGASLMIILLSGSAGSFFLIERAAGSGPLAISLAAFAGAALSTAAVTVLATTGGRISVPTLLLVGIAINAIVGGAIAAMQRFAVEEADLMRALMTWTFGRLDDRSGYHVVTIWIGLSIAIALIPRVAAELDLFAAGEDDAHNLGVDTGKVKWLALGAGALCASLAVSVAGQIAFVGLITPHILRRLAGPSHRSLLWLSLLGGPVLLCGAELAQRLILGHAVLPPGVVMSLLGGPFFLVLLMRNRSSVEAW